MVFTKTEQAVADMVNDPVKKQKLSDFMKRATPDQKQKVHELFKDISGKIKQEKAQAQADIVTQVPTTPPQKIFKKKSFDQINPVVDEWNGFKVRKNTKGQKYYFDKQGNAQLVDPKNIVSVQGGAPILGNTVTPPQLKPKSSPHLFKYTPPKELTVPKKNDFISYDFKQKYGRLPNILNDLYKPKSKGASGSR